MQSMLQYRRFRRNLEAQIGRSKEKIQSMKQNGNPEPGTTPYPESPERDSDKEMEEGKSPGSMWDTSAGVDTHDPVLERELFGPDHEHPIKEEVEEPGEEEEESRHASLASSPESLEYRPDNLSRMTTQRSQRTTLSRSGTNLGQVMTGINIRKRNTKEGGAGDVFVVGYEGDNDTLNPHNWSIKLRCFITIMIASIGFVVGLASAIDSSVTAAAAEEFGVSEVAEVCATGLYLIGFGAGSLFAGPFSETVGRNPVYIVTLVLYMIFVMASGLAPNLGAQLAFRFLAGFFGSTPLTCAGGSLSDIWNADERTTAFPVFANAAFLGPILGPVMGGWIAQSAEDGNISWRWTEWTTLIMSGLVFALVVLFQPETFPPILLKWKAKHLRELTGDERYRAEVEIRQESFMTRLGRALYRPFLLTATEPIILLVALYLTVIYIILFTFLDGYDFIYGEIHGVSSGIQGLCFLGIAVGLFIASPLVFVVRRISASQSQKDIDNGGDGVLPPEFRLWFGMFGAPAVPISLFWMGWTSDSNISIWSPIIASVLFGYGILCIFISCYQYIIDSYEIYAASALASVTLIRYIAAGGMTIVGIPFYENLGVHYTTTILACIAIVCTPVPYAFYIWGAQLRAKSRYAPKKAK